jgi:aspartate/methionine/tyrosine aminotransferase
VARRPEGNPALRGLRGSVYSALAERLREHVGPLYPLHVGDTYLSPPPGAHLSDQSEEVAPGIHRYENPRGRATLLEAVAAHRSARDGVAVEPAEVLVTAGATAGLAAAVQALLSPGQRLVVLAPYWPLIRGMSVSFGLDVVEVPFYDRTPDAATARERLEAALTPATGAVYVNWPNNPSGLLSPPEVMAEVVDVARRHDLWILSDEVYEDYVYGGRAVARAALLAARERLVSVYSFSKAYGMAGNRVGYLVGPREALQRIGRLTTYTVYSVNTAGQRAAEVALREGGAWLAAAKAAYEATGRLAAARLGEPAPAGGTFLFVDVAASLDERGVLGLLEDCLEGGLLIAPGASFGEAYGAWVRLCFTSVPPDAVMAGVEVLARRLGR